MLANKSNILPFYIPPYLKAFHKHTSLWDNHLCFNSLQSSRTCQSMARKKLQDTCKAKASIRHDGRNWHGPLGTWKYSAPCSWERRGCGDSYQGFLKGQCTTGSTFPIGLWQVATSALGSCFVDGREKDPHPPPPPKDSLVLLECGRGRK